MTDRKGELQAIDRCAANLSHVQSVLADGGYVGQPFAQAVKDKLGATVQIAKRNELHTFAVIPQRWVVDGLQPAEGSQLTPISLDEAVSSLSEVDFSKLIPR